MTGADRWKRPPKRPVGRGRGNEHYLQKRQDVCPKCFAKLDPSKLHDCGDQPPLF